MIVLNRFISPSQMRQSRTDFVHQKIIGGIERKSLVKKINCDIVLSLDKEQDGHRTVNVRIVLVELYGLVKHVNQVLIHLFDVLDFECDLVLDVLWDDVGVEFY